MNKVEFMLDVFILFLGVSALATFNSLYVTLFAWMYLVVKYGYIIVCGENISSKMNGE